MHFRPLDERDFPAVHAAFLDAFSDYEVPFRISEEELAEMLRRRGYVPAASIGVFDGDLLAAFTLNGIGHWNGRRTGYDTGTGVVQSHRGRGLAHQMIDAASSLLRVHDAEQYLLEVLQTNERAFSIYRDAGFEVTRELQCWRLDPIEAAAGESVETMADVDRDRVATFFDAPPSWQNSIASIRRARAPRKVFAAHADGSLVGCAVVFENGDLPFLAVDRAFRRRGIGRRLLAAAAAGRALRIINVDASLETASRFLEACGATKTVAQFEMIRKL